MKKQSADVAVIGGGASGMLAAAVAASRGMSVILIEKNPYTGKKLRITGKGRCNLTNNCSVRDMLDNIPTNPKFLYSALNTFSPTDTIIYFENLGLKLKTERGGRVFPESDKAADVVAALRRNLDKSGVTVINDVAREIKCSDSKVTSVVTDSEEIACTGVILCTGGASYPLTGSTGDGYRMAEKLGHNIIEAKPSLVPLEAEQGFCAQMQGLALKNVRLSVYNKSDKLAYEDFGEMLFTHFGISGPVVLSASAHMKDFKNDKYYVKIDLKPALDEKKLDARLLRDFEKNANKDYINTLPELVNKSMVPVIADLTRIAPETKVHSITHEQRVQLLRVLKGLRIDIAGPRPIDEAIITSGGVDVREIIPSTMESKLVKGLFFAGEIIDVDAYTGGFNLQIAWSTAYTAGLNAGR